MSAPKTFTRPQHAEVASGSSRRQGLGRLESFRRRLGGGSRAPVRDIPPRRVLGQGRRVAQGVALHANHSRFFVPAQRVTQYGIQKSLLTNPSTESTRSRSFV